MPLEPEPDVDKAPSPPTDPPGSPEPAESAKPRTSKKKSKVEAWIIFFVISSPVCSGGKFRFLSETQSLLDWFLWHVHHMYDTVT